MSLGDKDYFYFESQKTKLFNWVSGALKELGCPYDINDDSIFVSTLNNILSENTGPGNWWIAKVLNVLGKNWANDKLKNYQTIQNELNKAKNIDKNNEVTEYSTTTDETKIIPKKDESTLYDNPEIKIPEGTNDLNKEIEINSNIPDINNTTDETTTATNEPSTIKNDSIKSLVQPKVEVDKIEIYIGKDQKEEAESVIKNYGPFIPVLKIKDVIINAGDIIYYWYTVDFNSSPIFVIKIDDSFNRFKAIFKDDEIITGVAFIGNKNWYHKANIIINDTLTDSNGVLTLYGIFYNPKIYESVQAAYNEKSLIDIYTDICNKTDLGLYLHENDKLTQQLPLILNPNIRYIDLINDLVTKYTQNNFWCIDNYYILHLQNYDTLMSKETDKYTMKDNVKLDEPAPVIITNYPNPENEISEDLKKFVAYTYTVNNNVGMNMLNLAKSYTINNENINSHEKIGFGVSSANTFSKFKDNSFPFYSDIFMKEIAGNMFELKMQQPILEIFPFMIVETEIYNLSENTPERTYIKNDTHSGKHIVMGYEFEYSKPNSSSGGLVKKPEIIQTIKLI